MARSTKGGVMRLSPLDTGARFRATVLDRAVKRHCGSRNLGLSPTAHTGVESPPPRALGPLPGLLRVRPFWSRVNAAVWTLIAFGVLAAGLAARLGFDPLLEERATYIFFVPAVVIAAIRGLIP